MVRPENQRQCLLFDIVLAQSIVSAAWFNYAPQSSSQTGSVSQRWVTLQALYTPGDSNLKQVPIYAVIGGLFNVRTQTATLPVGVADIVFASRNAMTLNCTFTNGEFSGLAGTINEQTIAPLTQCAASL